VEQKSLLNSGKPRYEIVPHEKERMLAYVKDNYTNEVMSGMVVANILENFEYLHAVCDMYNKDYNLYLDQILSYCFFNKLK